MSKAEYYDEDDDIQVYKVSRPNVSYTGNGTATTKGEEHMKEIQYAGNGTADIQNETKPTGFFFKMPPKREWAGLTEDEVALIVADCSLVTPSDFYFAQAIEAKLKEKNT
jgi:hypothetical protein